MAMLVEFNIPDLPEPSSALSNYWLRYFFVAAPSQNREVSALASTYMRLVEAAIIEYRLGSAALHQVWSDHTSIQLGAWHRSISHFESCVTDLHRAIATYRRLRRHPARDPLSVYLQEPKPSFISDKIAFQVRNARDAIHHLDEKVSKGKLAEGTSIALAPNGPEVPHPTEPGQTIKTFDRLIIGSHQLALADVAAWLTEMESIAARLAQFDPRAQASGQ